jgi:hypothetical protein
MHRLFKSSIFFAVCFTSFTDLEAQTVPIASVNNAPQHFLWYPGHWSKSKKNSFITNAYTDSTDVGIVNVAGGKTITLKSDGSVNMNSGDVDTWNKKITDGVNDLDKIEKQLTDPSNQVQEWAYHFNKVAMSQLDTIKVSWATYKIDKKENVLNPQQDPGTSMQNSANSLNSWCKEKQPQYQEIIDFYTAHRHDKPSDYNNLTPPEFDFNCIACDTNLVKEHDKEVNDYVQKFFKPESDLIRNGLGMIRQLILMGHSDDVDNTPINVSMDASMKDQADQAFHHDKTDPSKSGTCSYFDSYKLNQAVQFLVMRCLWRADKLLSDNKKNFKTAMPVIRVYLGAAKQNELMGFTVDERFSDLGALVKMAYDYYFNKLVKDHDWLQLANIPFILSLSRQYTLLTGQEMEGTDQTKLFKVLNSFQLNIEMDIKVGKEGGYMLTHLKGKAKIAPEFAYNEDSCYQWVITEDKPNSLGEPIKKADQKIDVDLLSNEVIYPKERPTYTGTKKYWTMLQQLKMDYCHPGKDTILLTGFIPTPPSGGTWIYPHMPQPVPAGINSLDHYFQDINKIKELAESGKAQQQAAVAKEQAEKLIAQMKGLQQQMGNRRDASQIANFQKMQNLATQTRQLFSNQNIAPISYIDFPLQIQNNTPTLFNKKFDAKEIDPKLANIIVYGYYTIDIEYKE